MGSFSIWHWIVLIVILVGFFLPIIVGIVIMGPQKAIIIKHESSGLIRNGYVGYSWTYFFLGWLVPVIRGEIAVGLMHFALTLITFGLFQLVMPFLYNKQYMIRMLTSGWGLADSDVNNKIAKLKIGMA